MQNNPDNPGGKYILGPGHEVIAQPDLLKWAEWFEDADRVDKGQPWRHA